jgi:hypothetical protein
MLNDINTWTGTDPHPTATLSEISRHSQRALSLIVRNRKRSALQNGFINILGAVEMLSGLEHHYDNFDRICRRAKVD